MRSAMIMVGLMVLVLSTVGCATECDIRYNQNCFRHNPYDGASFWYRENNPPNMWPYNGERCRGLTRSQCLSAYGY